MFLFLRTVASYILGVAIFANPGYGPIGFKEYNMPLTLINFILKDISGFAAFSKTYNEMKDELQRNFMKHIRINENSLEVTSYLAEPFKRNTLPDLQICTDMFQTSPSS